jgi:hypothetical protein
VGELGDDAGQHHDLVLVAEVVAHGHLDGLALEYRPVGADAVVEPRADELRVVDVGEGSSNRPVSASREARRALHSECG